MSHDQKPGRIKVVGQQPAVATEEPGRPLPPGAGTAGTTSTATIGPRQTMLVPALFIIGCAIGGVVLPVLHIV